MKTAVSIPDAIFKRAELFARHAKRSRSQLFSDALAEYLARHSGDEITDAMNRVIDATGNAVEPFTSAASQRALARVEW
jgi:metal-responsive CopG/Arc/MetJ family transcriptional regulator